MKLLIWATAWQNQRNDLCTQQRLRSACTSAQSDQSLLCAQWVAKDPRFLHADSEDSDQTGQMPRLIRVFAGHIGHLLVLSCCSSFIVSVIFHTNTPSVYSQDIITDLVVERAPIKVKGVKGAFVHTGMLQSAKYVQQKLQEEKILDKAFMAYEVNFWCASMRGCRK